MAYNETPLKGNNMTNRAYYYGDGTDHKIWLSEAGANAVNKIRIFDIVETDEGTFVKTNLSEEEMKDYSEAADILNSYHEEFGAVPYTNLDIPMLRPAV